ncbi:excinuclease ABC subunit UvrC [Cellvibrio polysaccharolyticus]|uniref:UvrABC system protein C n=1 Tax=Cellvibrio polysaccharolyticus TaxID=2082724 RepID=A0A928V6K5_9GAMM|nr:excinuclease ABC subunit UvrC [Cellvibrio polysaccharolyticus]MBE8717587.1 excinuclease ABC subunit UvrC [Cellvibrio polysaccharolyticus]
MTSDRSSVFDASAFLANTSQQPGIYQMFDADGKILYVGKAKNLKSRLSSYFRKTGLSPKTVALVAKIASVEVTITASETEALILEQNLIKANRPPYNILLRDDKSYPYIFISSGEDFPRISFHRGARKKRGEYYGPYPNVSAVRDSLSFLQKTFKIRQCEDSVFNNRSRPCLQYQIKRCTAPCVDFISPDEYASDVRHTRMFLTGDNQALMQELANQMEAAAQQLNFERAGELRDQISAMRQIQTRQVVEEGNGDIDVVAAVMQASAICVHILFIRQGRILGSRSFFPQSSLAESESELLGQFLPQFYLASEGKDIPREVIVSHEIDDAELLMSALQNHIGRQIYVSSKVRGHRAQWLQMADTAAKQNLTAHINSKKSSQARFFALQEVLGLEELPQRLECFDISHSGGELTVASCVVFDLNGPLKSDYRRFNIEGITGGDDYAAMAQALERRYTRLQKGEGKLPDILLIDGGKGQLGKAIEVLNELGVTGVKMIGVAKGTTRKAGFETLFDADSGREIVLSGDSPALHLIQHIRDESHRFAITGHKQRRDKKRRTSTLEELPGIGATRRRELLRHFGGLKEIARASVNDLAKVNGISVRLAEDIYAFFHND